MCGAQGRASARSSDARTRIGNARFDARSGSLGRRNPASIPATKKGRGSIEDPEVLENVPGHIIPILEREFDDFDTESAKYLRGETPETEFIGFRLKQGVYGQRQPDVQ